MSTKHCNQDLAPPTHVRFWRRYRIRAHWRPTSIVKGAEAHVEVAQKDLLGTLLNLEKSSVHDLPKGCELLNGGIFRWPMNVDNVHHGLVRR
eukprot:4643229-Amphidinium_carterae.2